MAKELKKLFALHPDTWMRSMGNKVTAEQLKQLYGIPSWNMCVIWYDEPGQEYRNNGRNYADYIHLHPLNAAADYLSIKKVIKPFIEAWTKAGRE